MVVLYKHKQEKITRRKNLTSNCYLTLSSEANFLEYSGEFYSEFLRLGEKYSVTFFHSLKINKKNGDINIAYTINTDKSKTYKLHKSGHWIKKNNFDYLKELTDRGFYSGEHKQGYWGLKYEKALGVIFQMIQEELRPHMYSSYILDKNYEAETSISPLYDLIVDFHLNKKKIKGHDQIYHDIRYEYPKAKWLKQNDNKFIPAVLDSYGIKSGFLIKGLSSRKQSKAIVFKSLSFLSKLFGENYVDYLTKIDWLSISSEKFSIKKYFICKNDHEKNSLVSTFNNWDETNMFVEGKLKSVHELFFIREKIEECGIELKFKSKNTNDFGDLIQKYRLDYKYIKTGYKMRYAIPDHIINELEQPIICGDKVYSPKVVNTEDQFRIEGHLMKNCMSTQFNLGTFYLYISISQGKKRVNTQFRKGSLVQARGKANIDLPEDFKIPVEILSERMIKFKDLSWNKEKYDFINKS